MAELQKRVSMRGIIRCPTSKERKRPHRPRRRFQKDQTQEERKGFGTLLEKLRGWVDRGGKK
jgi:predicted RNA-binding protein with RPS1 domain